MFVSRRARALRLRANARTHARARSPLVRVLSASASEYVVERHAARDGA
jgi:hypothetical protein